MPTLHLLPSAGSRGSDRQDVVEPPVAQESRVQIADRCGGGHQQPPSPFPERHHALSGSLTTPTLTAGPLRRDFLHLTFDVVLADPARMARPAEVGTDAQRALLVLGTGKSLQFRLLQFRWLRAGRRWGGGAVCVDSRRRLTRVF